MKSIAFVEMTRPLNALMAAGAVCLGAWISSSPLTCFQRFLLATVAFLATGFGNTINDIMDIETDRVSHPSRPLPRGTFSVKDALIFACVISLSALFCAFFVGLRFGFATLVPLLLLTAYALFIKGVPLTGNLLVSLLAAYALVFGSLSAPCLHYLYIPALLAMLLNFCREIVKDIQDRAGDLSADIFTSAALSHSLLKKIILVISILYALLLFLPFFLGHFGIVYAAFVSATCVPAMFYRLFLLRKRVWETRLPHISALLKVEMLFGLCALSADRLFSSL